MSLGWFHLARGDPSSAFKCFVRARDVCSAPRHVVEMCVACVRAAAAMGQWAHVPPYVARAEQAAAAAAQAAQAQAAAQLQQAQAQGMGMGGQAGGGAGGGGAAGGGGSSAAAAAEAAAAAAARALDPASGAALRAALGIAHLDARRYRDAARSLTDLGGGAAVEGSTSSAAAPTATKAAAQGPPRPGSSSAAAAAAPSIDLGAADGPLSGIASGRELALYAALCSLAAFDRPELKRRCVDNHLCRELLEMHPQARDLVLAFCDASYAPALALLRDVERSWAPLDPLLQPHMAALAAAVRQRAAVQFSRPYSRVSLSAMARALDGADPRALRQELAALVAGGAIPGMRLDLSAAAAAAGGGEGGEDGGGFLVARTRDARREAVAAVLGAADAFARDTKAALLRASALRHDMLLRTGVGGGGGPGSGGGGTPGGGGGGGVGGPRGPRRGGDRRQFERDAYMAYGSQQGLYGGGGGGGGGGGEGDDEGLLAAATAAAMGGGGGGGGGGGSRVRASSRRGAGGA
jgi:hypothetical protein